MFQNQNPCWCFYITVFLKENFGCHFHLILHIMSDKAAFVSGALLCVKGYRGNRAELCFVHSVTVETERSSAWCTALPWKPSGALLCAQRYRGNRAELCLVYSVTVETEQSSALCTALPWKPSGALLGVQRYRGNRAELCFVYSVTWKPLSGALLGVQRYRGNRAELCLVYSVTVETERSSAWCTVLPWKPRSLQQRLPLADN